MWNLPAGVSGVEGGADCPGHGHAHRLLAVGDAQLQPDKVHTHLFVYSFLSGGCTSVLALVIHIIAVLVIQTSRSTSLGTQSRCCVGKETHAQSGPGLITWRGLWMEM